MACKKHGFWKVACSDCKQETSCWDTPEKAKEAWDRRNPTKLEQPYWGEIY